MSEEIKEILDKLKDSNWYDELDLTGTRWIELTWKETHLLLDYITNLQQKVEQLEKENKELKNIINELEKEIDRLNNKIEQLRTELNTKDNIINGQQKRINKTIEAIDEILVYNDLTDTTSAFGNASRELKFYLSECETLEEFDKLKELKENK